jgi:hypothetical protein
MYKTFLLLLMVVIPISANAHRVTVNAIWFPEMATQVEIKSNIININEQKSYQSISKQPSSWVFDLESNSFDDSYQVKIEGDIPQGYKNRDLYINLSVESNNKPLILYSGIVNIGCDASSIRLLYGTNISQFSQKRLYRFYQEAISVALSRKDRCQGHLRNLHAYTIQACFKALETAVALQKATEGFFKFSPDVVDIKDWLVQVYSVKSALVNRAIGEQNYKQIIDLVENEEGRLKTFLWNRILSEKNCEKRYDALKKYYSYLENSSSYDDITSITRVTKAMALSSINQCASSLVLENVIENKSEQIELLSKWKTESKKMVELTGSREEKRKLESDVIVLTNHIKDLQGDI